jgi:hypothetical protein
MRTALLNSESFYTAVYPPEIICDFGDFGQTSANYVDATDITCLTPDNADLYEQISYKSFNLTVAMNGHSFDDSAALASIEVAETTSSAGGASAVVYIIMAVLIGLLLMFCIIFLLDHFYERRRERNPELLELVSHQD